MKRILMLGTGMAVLSAAIYLGSTLSAQQPGTPPTQAAPQAAPQTKIALINLNYVLKNYVKCTAFQAQMKQSLTTYQEQDRALVTALENKKKDFMNPATAQAQKDAIDLEVKTLTRQREDNTAKGKKDLGDKSDVATRTLYIEVADAAKRYAASHGIELVMHYNEALDKDDIWGAPNIARKMQAGACIPIDYAPGMDISYQIVQALNAQYQANQAPPPAGAQPAGNPGARPQ